MLTFYFNPIFENMLYNHGCPNASLFGARRNALQTQKALPQERLDMYLFLVSPKDFGVASAEPIIVPTVCLAVCFAVYRC